MYKDKKVTAIVTAAGKGSRMGASLPKQFLKIGSKTILEKAILPFEKADFIDQIIVVSGAEFVEVCKGLCAGITKLKAVVEGGKERQDSVNNALKLVEDGYVLIHDGARPYITERVILNVLEDVSKVGAAVAAVPVKDTIRQQTEEGGNKIYRGLPVTSIAALLPFTYLFRNLIPEGIFVIVLHVLLAVVAFLFIFDFTVKKPDIGKIFSKAK